MPLAGWRGGGGDRKGLWGVSTVDGGEGFQGVRWGVRELLGIGGLGKRLSMRCQGLSPVRRWQYRFSNQRTTIALSDSRKAYWR